MPAEKWLILHGESLIGIETSPEYALAFAIQITNSERNVRVVAPNGVKLDEFALALLCKEI